MEFKFGYLETQDVLQDGSLKPALLGNHKTVLMVKSDSCSVCKTDLPLFRAIANKTHNTKMYAANPDVGILLVKKYLNMNLSFVPVYIGIEVKANKQLEVRRLGKLSEVEKFVK